MKIIQINKFLFRKGGDAICALDTGDLLKEHGHEAAFWGMEHPENPEYYFKRYFVPYVDYDSDMTITQQMIAGRNLLYSNTACRQLRRFLDVFPPDIAHVHNFAHQISPSILDVFKKNKIPVVMTMHDYKLVCASYLLHDGRIPCHACGDGKYYRCLIKKCVKSSRVKSMLNTIEMYFHHKALHIYDTVDIFISPSMFLKEMLRKMGFTQRIVVIPNFINAKSYCSVHSKNGYFLYFGRLTKEKGLYTLLRAVQRLDIDIHIVGTGPCETELKQLAADLGIRNVQFRGHLLGEPLFKEIAGARCIVLPSEWYENNPRSMLEAFAFGKPVIGADIGGIPELMGKGEHGFLFTPGSHEELREKIEYCLSHPDDVKRRGRAARLYVENYHNQEKYYEKLMDTYAAAIEV
jgi:glycosyltransferase involved in cell wall biosynthesis